VSQHRVSDSAMDRFDGTSNSDDGVYSVPF